MDILLLILHNILILFSFFFLSIFEYLISILYGLVGDCWIWHWSGSNGEYWMLGYLLICSFNSPCNHMWQGNRAIAEIQFADYIYPAFDQASILLISVLTFVLIPRVPYNWWGFLFNRLLMKLQSSDTGVGISMIVEVFHFSFCRYLLLNNWLFIFLFLHVILS